MTPAVTLLGPQRLRPILKDTLSDLGIAGPVALVTAGWQEREREDGELQKHIGREVRNLELYRLMYSVLSKDPKLSRALHQRQDRLREMQDLYRLRLNYAMQAVEDLQAKAAGGSKAAAKEMERAFEAVRQLDATHLESVSRVHREFERTWKLDKREELGKHRKDVAELVESSDALLIAGGHVVVLLNRLRLFSLPRPGSHKPIVAWSAGAMALGGRIVLFHDSPPQGRGYAEVLESGSGSYLGLHVFPHARHRLRLEDRERVMLLSRRFAPDVCVTLDEGDRVDTADGEDWMAPRGIRQLHLDGSVTRVEGP